jgi:hypothetical protein
LRRYGKCPEEMEPAPVVKDQGLGEVEEATAAVDKAVVLERGQKGIVFVHHVA